MRKKIIHRITFKINVISPLLFLLFCFISMLSYGVNIEVVPTLIEFDYKEGYADDALQISDNTGKLIEGPEWDGVNPSHNCAYIMGQSKRMIKVYFNSNYSGNMNLIINLSYSNLENGIGKICNLFIPNYNGQECVLELSGTLPQSVGKHTFTWNWDIYAMPTEPSSYCAFSKPSVTTHTYYTLLDLPKAPMATPWVSVLDTACVWAAGKNTEADVLNSLTSYLYLNSGLDYNPDQSHYDPYPLIGSPIKYEFNLTGFLAEWNNADCQDCSMFLSILSSSLGSSLNQTRRIQGSFFTKLKDPIGSTYGWISSEWQFHQVGWLNNVYDPTTMLNKPAEYIPIDIGIEIPYKNDLFSNGSWNVYDAFYLGQTDPFHKVPTGIK